MWLSAKVDLRRRPITRDKKEHFKMIKVSVHPEDKTILIVYALENRALKYNK